MNPEIFAEWLTRQGYKVYKTESSFWFNQGYRALQAFPYDWLISPNNSEIRNLLKQSGAMTLRYSAPISSREGKISYHASYESKEYGIEILGKWARKNVRRGLANCEVKKISFEQLAEEGYDLQVNTLERQGRKLDLTKQEWETRCLSAADLKGFDAWGAFVEEKLAASVITFHMNYCVYMLFQQCQREYLDKHVNNALSFVVTTNLLADPTVNSILYGLHSLDAPPSVDEFKFRMGYHAKPVRQRVIFNPLVAPLFNRVTHAGLESIHKLIPGNPTIAKAEGMVRFYLEGKLPLGAQQWPDALLDQKETILAGISKG